MKRWLTACLLLALAEGAAAQGRGPVQLFKPDSDPPASSQPTQEGARDPSLPPASAPPPAVTASPGGIDVSTLSAMDPAGVGMSDAEGGLGADLWQGSSHEAVVRFLDQLPVETATGTARALTRRLLLTAATPPAAKPGLPSIYGLRISRLVAGGMLIEAAELLRRARPAAGDHVAGTAEIDLLLLLEDDAGACQRIQALVRETDGADIVKALAYCQAQSGNKAAAQTSLGILREQKVADDGTLRLLAILVGEASGRIDSLPKPSPLQLAILRQLRQPIPNDFVANAGPGVLAAVLRLPVLQRAPDQRLRAAERAEALGVLSAEGLAQVYAAIEFKPEQLEAALSEVSPAAGANVGALFHRAGELKANPRDRLRALRLAIAHGRHLGQLPTMARVNRSLTRDIAPGGEHVIAAPDIVRSLLASGDLEGARNWFEFLTRVGGAGEGETALTAIGPLMVLADAKLQSPSGAKLRLWVAGQPEPDRAPRFGLLVNLLHGLGLSVDGEAGADLPPGPAVVQSPMPSPWLWQIVQGGSHQPRGETIAAIVALAADKQAAKLHPAAWAAMIETLRGLKLDKEAHTMAVELGLAAGL
ncbi:MAG: hypothetical protein FJX46_00065 [Alphaproteobacteria bacterium]|nr:hypothetical protein [Alphaproteobacteria bacterium]